MTRGTLKSPASSVGVGRVGQRLVAVERRPHLVGAIGGVPRDDVRGRRHAGRVDLLHLFGVGEDVAELAREELDLRSRRARGCASAAIALDLLARESGGHGKC